jgi:SAM-dependent methyltransferase
MTSSEDALWASGSAYEAFVGRWSHEVAGRFLEWLGAEHRAKWLDVGCGTGALSDAILDTQDPLLIRGIDPSPQFVTFAGDRLRDARAVFEVGNAEALDAPASTYDVVVCGLVLNFVPRPTAALREFARVLRSGGMAGVYVWDYAGEMQMLRYFWDAAAALDQRAAEFDEGRRFTFCTPDGLAQLFRGAGLRNVATCAVDVPTKWSDFEAFWQPFTGGTGAAPSYVASLSVARRDALRDRLRAEVPTEDDGSISMMARAWAVKGVAP